MEGGGAIFADPVDIADRYHRAVEAYQAGLRRAVLESAVDYHRATILRPSWPRDPKAAAELNETLDAWDQLPVEKLPVAEVKKYLAGYSQTFRALDAAARAERCDWELAQKISVNNLDLFLPEVQTYRELARFQRFRVRVDLVENDFDAAVREVHPGVLVRRVLLGREDHVVPGLPREPLGNHADPESGVGHEEHVIGPRRVDQLRGEVPDLSETGEPLPERGDAVRRQTLRVVVQCPHRRRGQRRDRGVVEERPPRRDRELRAEHGPVHQ